MTSFDKFNKAANDLINTGYVHNAAWNVQFQHTDKTMAFSQMAMPLTSQSISTTANLRRMGQWGFIDGKFSGNSLGVNTSLNIPGLPGTVFTTNYTQKLDAGNGGSTADTAIECVLPQLSMKSEQFKFLTPHMKFSYAPLKQTWGLATTSGFKFGQLGSLSVGAKASGALKGSHVDYTFGVVLTQFDNGKVVTLSALTYPHEGLPMSKYVGSIHFRNTAQSRVSELGAELTHYPQKAQAPDFAIAAQLALGDQTKGDMNSTMLKAKLTKDAKIALALTHKLNPKLSSVFGLEMQAGKPETMKHGFTLKVTT